MKNGFSRRQLGIPYGIFLILFVAAPLIVLIYYGDRFKFCVNVKN